MAAPTRLQWKREFTGSSVPTTVNLEEIPTGSWMLAVFTVGGTNDLSTGIPEGWTNLLPNPQQRSGTRRVSYIAKIKEEGDVSITMNTVNTNAAKCLTVMWGAGAKSADTWRAGLVGVRASADVTAGQSTQAGSSTTSIAPGLSSVPADSLVVSVLMEATSVAGAFNITSGATEWFTTGDSGSVIEQLAVGYTTPSDPTTFPVVATAAVSQASNGQGVQIIIPAADATPPNTGTGNIKSQISTSPDSTSLTIGFVSPPGSIVRVGRSASGDDVVSNWITASPDDMNGWGNVTFTGLQPNNNYFVGFSVDGVRQTDADMLVRTLPGTGPQSFNFVAGSCQFTGSNHPVWEAIFQADPAFISHMGDLHYADATDSYAWRTAVESSLSAPRMKGLLQRVPIVWSWDNHDRIITDKGGEGGALNFGTTDPMTLSEWRKLAGNAGWASDDTGGRTWVAGRVRFIQTDHWTVKDDPDFDSEPRTFLGADQKQWFKDTLENSTEEVIVWLCQWPSSVAGSGRWNSYQAETNELTSWINARPGVKSRMIMIGGDSHSVQWTDGSRTQGNFVGIPSLNASGFNRSSDAGHGGAGWNFDAAIRQPGQLESNWGAFSRVSVNDNGQKLTFLWEAVRVDQNGNTDVMTSYSKTFGEDGELPTVYLGSEAVELRMGAEPASLA